MNKVVRVYYLVESGESKSSSSSSGSSSSRLVDLVVHFTTFWLTSHSHSPFPAYILSGWKVVKIVVLYYYFLKSSEKVVK